MPVSTSALNSLARISPSSNQSAEHHTLYNYQLWGAANHYIGLLQVETVSSLINITALCKRSRHFVAVLPAGTRNPSSFYGSQLMERPDVFRRRQHGLGPSRP